MKKTYLRDSSASRGKSFWKDYGQAFVLALVIAVVVRTFLIQPYKIPSESMRDTLLVGDHLMATKFDYGLRLPFIGTVIYEGRAPEVGEIVIFKYPRDPDTDFIKRVEGVPGDVIEMRNKQLFRNGQPVVEPYARVTEPDVSLPVRDNFGPVTVPPGHFFVMGDNRDNSMDSRFWGFVAREAVVAKARRIYWSWDGPSDIRWSRIGSEIR